MGVPRTAVLAVLALIGILIVAPVSSAQYVSYFAHGDQPTSGYPQTGGVAAGSSYSVPAAYSQVAITAYNDSPQAAPMPVVPAGFNENMAGAYGFEEESGYCDECLAGGGGCGSYCGGGAYGPYEDNTCGPRWFDVSAEFVFLQREGLSRFIEYSRDGLLGSPVLSTNDLGFHEEPGLRVTGRVDIGAASNIEVSYLGTFNWSSAAQATSGIDDLYSLMSGFATVPPGGFVETDQGSLHSIEYNSQLDSGELSFRHHWVSPGMRLQGSWLMGVRYTVIDERFTYITHADAHLDPDDGNAARGPGDMNYRVKTSNNLLGFQLGGDAYACVLPGLTAGGEIKAGVYGNHARQRSTIVATSGQTDETANSNHVALVAEAGANFVYQLTPGWSFRGGYSVMFIDGVALAPENLNGSGLALDIAVMGGTVPARVVGINDNGNVLYHGLTAGVEWLW